MSPAMAGLVETSSNLASVKPQPADSATAAAGGGAAGKATYSVIVSTRSSIPAALAAERGRVAAVAKLAGAAIEQPPDYAGW